MPLERSAFNSLSNPYISWLNKGLRRKGCSASGGSHDSLCEDDERLGSATGEPAPRGATSNVEEADRACAPASGGSPHSPIAADLGMGSASGESSTSGESSDQVPPIVMTSPAPKLQRPHAGPRILGTLGKGAFGTVSKCVWKGRVLAMKVVKRVRTAERELSIHTHLQQAPLCAEIAHLKACRKMPSGEYRFVFRSLRFRLARISLPEASACGAHCRPTGNAFRLGFVEWLSSLTWDTGRAQGSKAR